MTIHRCIVCRREFQAQRKDHRSCEVACRVRAHRIRKRACGRRSRAKPDGAQKGARLVGVAAAVAAIAGKLEQERAERAKAVAEREQAQKTLAELEGELARARAETLAERERAGAALATRERISQLEDQVTESRRQAAAERQAHPEQTSSLARECEEKTKEIGRLKAELIAKKDRGQAELRAEQQRSQAALEAERERGQAALLAEQQRSQAALETERELRYERLLAAMMKNFLHEMELQEQGAYLADLQQENAHLKLQCDTATAQLRGAEDRRLAETAQLCAVLDQKATQTQQLLSDHRTLRLRLTQGDQAKQRLQEELTASQEQAQHEKRRRLRSVRRAKRLQASNDNLAQRYQNWQQQLLAEYQSCLAAEVQRLQAEAKDALPSALNELHRLRLALATAQRETAQLRADRDRLTESNTALEADKSTLSLQADRYEERVYRLKEIVGQQKRRLRHAEKQERLLAASAQEESATKQGTGWGTKWLGAAAAGGAVGWLLGSSGPDPALPASSQAPVKRLPDGRSRRK